MKRLNILITGAGAPGFSSIYKCLRSNGERELRIIGVDMNPMASGKTLVDAFHCVPAARDPHFLDALLKVCEKEKVDVLVSIVTRELELLSKNREKFEAIGTKLEVMDYDPLHIANNKGLLLSTMKEAGLPTAGFAIAHTQDELIQAIYDLGYPDRPVVVKPTIGNGSRGIRFIDASKSRYDQFFNEKPNSQYMALEELKNIINEKDEIPEMIAMEYLPNGEISVDVLADHGNTLYCSCRQGEVVNSIMMRNVIRTDEEAAELVKAVVKLIKINGNANFDLRRDVNGKPQVMEINPRLPAGISCSVAAGVNFPYLRIKQVLGEELPECTLTEGYTMQFRNEVVICTPEGIPVKWKE